MHFYFAPPGPIAGETLDVDVNFKSDTILVGGSETRWAWYCTISVVDQHGKYQYYHGATVWNGKDRFNPVQAMFNAHTAALYKRYADYIRTADDPVTFKEYKRKWNGFLWALYNNEVDLTLPKTPVHRQYLKEEPNYV
jgi:hypothetical protein